MPDPRQPFRPDLEGLRGLAILLVVLYHAGVPGLAGGFVGVDVFFVLSGYFTTRLLVREYAASGSVDVAAFYGRRALRLLPLLFVVTGVTLAAVWWLYAPIDRAAVADAARAVALGTANHAFARQSVDYFSATESPLLHTWSLAVEAQVSLLWPPLFLGLAAAAAWWAGRRGPTGEGTGDPARRADGLIRGVGVGLAVLGAISLGLAVWLTETAPSWAFFGTASRLWEFALGGLLAVTLPDSVAPDTGQRSRWGWLQGAGLLAVAGAVAAYDRATPYPGVAALLPALGGAAILAGGALVPASRVARGLAAPALQGLGRLSYGWYLWHWPLVSVGAVVHPGLGVAGRLAWSTAGLGLAWVTYRLVERPAREGRLARAAAPWPAVTATAACVAAAFVATGVRAAAERRAARPDQRAFAAARVDRTSKSCWAETAAAALAAPPCVLGDPRGTVTVALLGDSHAEHWLAALDQLGRARGWRVVAMVKGGCPVSDAPELVLPKRKRWGRECARYRDAMLRRIVALRPAVAVLSSWDGYVTRETGPRPDGTSDGHVSPAAWGRGLRRTYARLAAAGVPTVALRGTPRPSFDVPTCLSRRAAGAAFAPACTYDRAAAVHPEAAAAQAAAARGLPVAVVDMNDQVCAAARCGVVRGGVVVFTDDNHLTSGFTRSAAPVLGARLTAAAASLGARLP